MGRKPHAARSPEEKWQILLEGMKSGNVLETCRRHGVAPNLYYRWKSGAEQGAKAALERRNAAEHTAAKNHHARQSERALGQNPLEIEFLKDVAGE